LHLVDRLSDPSSAFLVCDRIGRIWATRQLCVLWVLGIGIFMGAKGNLGAIYAGRFIAGLGVGQTVVVGPVYLAEIVSIPSHTVLMQS
jgi:MFS family permease